MKKCTLPLLVMICISMAITGRSQSLTDTSRYEETVRGMKRKKLILEFMGLSEAEKAAFWPLYDSYYLSIQHIEMESLNLIQFCYEEGENLHPREMNRYAKHILDNDLLLAKFRKQYYKKFSKALSPVRANEFMHFEETVRMMTRFEISSNAHQSAHAKASLH